MGKINTLNRLKAEERKLRQQIIVDAAREVFGQKTFDKASMAEIARAAGIAKSSIYTYFKSQEELYARIAYMDSCQFINDLKDRIDRAEEKECIRVCIHYFLEYYTVHISQWRMVTHFALHGKNEMGDVDKLNEIGRRLMDLFEQIFQKMGCREESRLMAHTLFSSLSGILIAFRNYPGRSEEERITHMKRIGRMVEQMIHAVVEKREGRYDPA